MRAGAALLLMAVTAAAPIPDEVRFITCPIYRDTDAGRKSGCWLADDRATGMRYDVTSAPSKPDWNRAILVEGRLSAEPGDPCGGRMLDPVRVSVLPDACTRHMLPAEGYAGRKFALPPRNVRPMTEARPSPARPWADRTFRLLFDFDSAFVIYQYDDFLLDQAIAYIRAVNPRKVIVTGYAATTPEAIGGRTLAEAPTVARERAERIALALDRLGVAKDRIEVRWEDRAQPVAAELADGLVAPTRRRVDIAVVL